MEFNIYTYQENTRESVRYKTILGKWLETVKYTVKDSSYGCYYSLVNTYIIPSLGELYTYQITTEIIEKEIRRLLSAGNVKQGVGLSAKLVSDILSIVKRTITYGIEQGFQIPCNINKLYVKKTKREMRVLDKKEQLQLQETLLSRFDRYRMGTLLSLYTGIRVGELCALKWEDIDLLEGILHIRKTLQRMKNFSGTGEKTIIKISSPKSANSIRSIPIPIDLIKYLKDYQGDAENYILTGNTKYAEPRVMQYHFKRYIQESHILDANFHCLRHTFATRCVENGFDLKSLSEILGHSTVNITLNKYVHASFELKKENMDRLTLL